MYELFQEYLCVPPATKPDKKKNQTALLFLCLPQIEASFSEVKTRKMACQLYAFFNYFPKGLSVFLKTEQGLHTLTNDPKTSAMILSLKLNLSTVLGHCNYVWLYSLYLYLYSGHCWFICFPDS